MCNPNDKTDKQQIKVGRDKWSQVVHANIVKVKGNVEAETAQGIKDFTTTLGYKHVELKTD